MFDLHEAIQSRPASCPEHGQYMSRSLFMLGDRTTWSHCPECVRLEAERKEAERRLEEERERQRRIEEKLNQAGIPLRFRGRSFDNFKAENKGQFTALNIAKEYAEEFKERFADGSTLVFSGLPGTGKSHLAIAICQHIMNHGFTAMYINALDAIRLVRSTWSRNSERSEAEVMSMLASVDLLAIDEVGVQYGTEGEKVILFDIINRRYQDQMPTVLMTNQGVDGFKEYLGERAFDRLREAGRWVAFDWESHRGKA